MVDHSNCWKMEFACLNPDLAQIVFDHFYKTLIRVGYPTFEELLGYLSSVTKTGSYLLIILVVPNNLKMIKDKTSII